MQILLIGGNRFFGKRLASKLLESGHQLTLLNRQSVDDGFGTRVRRIKGDRKNLASIATLQNQKWDLIYDQVCYDAPSAAQACDVFKGRVGKYIFTSTQSTYGEGRRVAESDFDPYTYQFEKIIYQESDYAEAKRQAEATFVKNISCPLTLVRFPLVLGPDDYTARLNWHLKKALNYDPIFFPNIKAEVSLLHAKDAADFLAKLTDLRVDGPINCCASKPIVLADLISRIERLSGKKILLEPETKAEESPYGVSSDFSMSSEKLNILGFRAREITEWIDELIISQLEVLTRTN